MTPLLLQRFRVPEESWGTCGGTKLQPPDRTTNWPWELDECLGIHVIMEKSNVADLPFQASLVAFVKMFVSKVSSLIIFIEWRKYTSVMLLFHIRIYVKRLVIWKVLRQLQLFTETKIYSQYFLNITWFASPVVSGSHISYVSCVCS